MQIKNDQVEVIKHVPGYTLTLTQRETKIITAALANVNFNQVTERMKDMFNDDTHVDNELYAIYIEMGKALGVI